MVKAFFLLLIIVFCESVAAQINIPQQSPAAKIQQQIGLASVSVTYSRPSLRGRRVLGTEQVPYGKPWRMGANNATVLYISDTIEVNKNKIAPGNYLLAAIPGKHEWTIILNKKFNQFGLYEYDRQEDLFRFTTKPVLLNEPVETLTFEFVPHNDTAFKLRMKWEHTLVEFLLAHSTDKKIKSEISLKTKNAENATVQTLYDAAAYYYNTDFNLEQAMEWASLMVAKEPFYWRYFLHAKIAVKLKQYDTAKVSCQKGLEQAVKDGDDAYIVALKKLLKEIEAK